MKARKLLNPDALYHLPCSKCGKGAEEINLEPINPGGTVVYQRISKFLAAIVGRKCTSCAGRGKGGK